MTFKDQAPLRSQLIGAWELVEYAATSATDPDDIIHPMGRDATGMIMYTPDGYMSAHLLEPGQNSFTTPGNASDYETMGRRSISYTGAFYLDEQGDEKGPILIHEMRVSNSPNLLGDRQRRLCEIRDEADGRYLQLSVAKPLKMSGKDRIPMVKWRRLPLNEATKEPKR